MVELKSVYLTNATAGLLVKETDQCAMPTETILACGATWETRGKERGKSTPVVVWMGKWRGKADRMCVGLKTEQLGRLLGN